MSRISLGTAQLGMPGYGIASSGDGYIDAKALLDQCMESGVTDIDTAQMYGYSEEVLGNTGMLGDSYVFNITTKIATPTTLPYDIGYWIERAVCHSASLLVRRMSGRKFIYGLLLHDPTLLLSDRGVETYEALVRVKRLGLVEKIGVSVYSPSDLDDLSAFHFDLVQAPLNILDRRLVASGWLSRLHESGTEVHVRSAFLQGLLLMEHRPVYFQAWEPLLKRYDDWIEVSGLTRVEACLRFALAHPEVSRVVVGVDSVEQLREALRAERGRGVYPPGDLQSYDDRLLNPSNWTP